MLQTEAAVQRNPNDASAWFELGVKQQENEREDKAIQALSRALELEPTHTAALLALAISHTNENNRAGTLGAIERWIDVMADDPRFEQSVRAHRALNPRSESADGYGPSYATRQKDLVECWVWCCSSTDANEAAQSSAFGAALCGAACIKTVEERYKDQLIYYFQI